MRKPPSRPSTRARAVGERALVLVEGGDAEVTVPALDAGHPLILADVEPVVLRDFAVVLEGLLAGGLLVGARERHVADLQQLRRGEEHHARGIVEQRVDQAALVDHHGLQPAALRFDAASEAGGPGANDQDVEDVVGNHPGYDTAG